MVTDKPICPKCGHSYKRSWDSIIADDCEDCISKRMDYDDANMLIKLLGITVFILFIAIVLLVYWAIA